jgi:hypothetical protein
MWSDTLLAAERSHLIRVALWGLTSASAGLAIVVAITLRRVVAPIVMQFAVQALVWGSLELARAAVALRGLAMRDVSGATRLDRSVWFTAGVDVGIICVGAVLATLGWVLGRRLALVGAGLGVLVQGLALLVLHLTFLSIIARLI